eukprot:170273_1
MKHILLVLSSIISISISASISERRIDKQPFTTEIFNNFKAEVLELIQCDDETEECPGLVGSHPDVTRWDSMGSNFTDKPLIAGIIRLAFHDCAETDPTLVAEGNKTEFQLSHKTGNTGGCNGCIDLNDPENDNLLDGSILPFEPICQYYLTYISRADCWALAATITSEFSASLNSVRKGFPFFEVLDSAIQDDDIPYLYGRVDCEADDPNIPYQNPASSSFTLPTASLGWSHQSYFFKSRFNWDSNKFENEYFTNKDIVGLISGGHSIGRAHEKISGFSGQWDFSEDTIDNQWISTMFNQEFGTTNFGPGRPVFGPLCPLVINESYGEFSACPLPYDPDTCDYDPSVCPLPDGHPLKLSNGQCVGQTGPSRYYKIEAEMFDDLKIRPSENFYICTFFAADQNWNMSMVGNFGNPQFGMPQTPEGLSLFPPVLELDPPLTSMTVALNTDMSLLWDLSWYLENNKYFQIDCNTHAVDQCPQGSVVLTANRSQNTVYTKFNIGKNGDDLGEIYECPDDEICCELIQCPVQCEGGIKEFNRLVENNLIDTLSDDSDCIHALSFRYSAQNKKDTQQANRNMGIDYANAFKKMISIGYYDRIHNDYQLFTVGVEDINDSGAANIIYYVLIGVAMVILFSICACGYYLWNKKRTKYTAHIIDNSTPLKTSLDTM